MEIYGNFQRNQLDEKQPKKPFLKISQSNKREKAKPTVYFSQLATNGNLI